ncbi:hypothetical protein TCAL_14612 [Tigriopus californicus]|uniref:Protein kinase domain-containing protein n=1 Tax=Tigriopus californicus TaxID=6832 RepID=A0A553PB76_TIGCA|nr:hypothetical protein TCAL_14612 [Tigriopus californicus]
MITLISLSDLPDYSKITFPRTTAIPLENLVPDAPSEAQALFKRFIKYDSKKRMSAQEALQDMYFFVPPFPARQPDMPKIPSKDPDSKSKAKEAQSPPFGSEAWETKMETAKFEDLFEDLLSLKV